MSQSFEEWLREKFANQYDGLDDEMPDAEGQWFSELDPMEVIDWAQAWHEGKKP